MPQQDQGRIRFSLILVLSFWVDQDAGVPPDSPGIALTGAFGGA
jgi:hypothetical protein